MKVSNLNKKEGTAKLQLERPEDSWVLTHIIEPGDLVRASTIRKIKKGAEEDRKATIIKKPVTLTIEVEKVEYAESSIRILGLVRDGPEDVPHGSHHTIDLSPHDTLSLKKKEGFAAHHLARINDAQKPPPGQVLMVVHDREEAFLCLVAESCRILLHLKGKVQKKAMEEKSEDFYATIADELAQAWTKYNPDALIVASPAFFKEDLLKVLLPELKKKAVMATCSSVTKNGIEEVLRRDEVKQALSRHRVAEQLKIIEQLAHEISKDGKAAYGADEVEKAAQAGAVASLLVTEGRIKQARESGKFKRLDEIMMTAERAGADLVLLDSETEPGKRLDGLGGIAALLRYRLS
ncbi:MAG TPA: mRNA surveillance protein pelota [Candidatus Nanoarchaeia archaeon]|nr:mRNA surveillance protein pelota [Candidatus Nanoarchaeia archaeon]